MEAWYFLHWNAIHVEHVVMYCIYWYVKNDTATEVRTFQCKFQHITVLLGATVLIIAYKLSDTGSLLDRNKNVNIKC
jgi:hypothetical protein